MSPMWNKIVECVQSSISIRERMQNMQNVEQRQSVRFWASRIIIHPYNGKLALEVIYDGVT